MASRRVPDPADSPYSLRSVNLQEGIDVMAIAADVADGAVDAVDSFVIDPAPFADGFYAIAVPAGRDGLLLAANELSIAAFGISVCFGVGFSISLGCGFGFSVAFEDNG
jgi:hypothetical protein